MTLAFRDIINDSRTFFSVSLPFLCVDIHFRWHSTTQSKPSSSPKFLLSSNLVSSETMSGTSATEAKEDVGNEEEAKSVRGGQISLLSSFCPTESHLSFFFYTELHHGPNTEDFDKWLSGITSLLLVISLFCISAFFNLYLAQYSIHPHVHSACVRLSNKTMENMCSKCFIFLRAIERAALCRAHHLFVSFAYEKIVGTATQRKRERPNARREEAKMPQAILWAPEFGAMCSFCIHFAFRIVRHCVRRQDKSFGHRRCKRREKIDVNERCGKRRAREVEMNVNKNSTSGCWPNCHTRALKCDEEFQSNDVTRPRTQEVKRPKKKLVATRRNGLPTHCKSSENTIDGIASMGGLDIETN